MNHNTENNRKNKIGNPEKAYREEMHDKGSTFSDTNAESAARDKAKIEKSLTGQGQKMDSVHPDELKESREDKMIERERREKE